MFSLKKIILLFFELSYSLINFKENQKKYNLEWFAETRSKTELKLKVFILKKSFIMTVM